MHRPGRKLWLPPEGAEAAGRANPTAPEASRWDSWLLLWLLLGCCLAAACFTSQNLLLLPYCLATDGSLSKEFICRLQNNGGEVGDPDTDLDVLTRQYEAEAEAAKAEALGEARTVALQSRGMAERRSDALATPLSSDTK